MKPVRLQLHFHVAGSSDSNKPLRDFIEYSVNGHNERTVLSPAGQNAASISVDQAVEYSNGEVFVIPAIELNINSSKRYRRRHLLLEGDLTAFISAFGNSFGYKQTDITEREILEYAASEKNPLFLILPHPITPVDYYGPKQVCEFMKRCEAAEIPYLVEVETGTDMFSAGKRRRCVQDRNHWIGCSDARFPGFLDSVSTRMYPRDPLVHRIWDEMENAPCFEEKKGKYMELLRVLIGSILTDSKSITINRFPQFKNSFYNDVLLSLKFGLKFKCFNYVAPSHR